MEKKDRIFDQRRSLLESRLDAENVLDRLIFLVHLR